MAEEQFIYAVTRVHNHEQGLLSAQDVEQLISAPSAAEAFRLLADKGWGAPELPPGDPDALVAYETGRTWALMDELVEDLTPFNVFRVKNDYHNLKAAIKLAYSANDESEKGQYFLEYGAVPLESIVKAANEHDFTLLPPDMAAAGRAAYEALAHTGNGQSCDVAIDRAALCAIDAAGAAAKSSLLRQYARLAVDSANIKAAMRGAAMRKSRDFLENLLAPAGSLDYKDLLNAAADGVPAVYAFLERGPYADAVPQLKQSMAAFERWCDNRMIELIRPQRNNYFTIEPLAAYILGRENEIRLARLILSAKINHLPGEALRERLRETYV